MKMPGIYSIALTVIVIGGSCEEEYKPKEINSIRQIPVIHGIIMEDKVPVVNLSWAIGYQDKVQNNISGAHVYITDNIGNSIDLEETSAGNYTSLSDLFKGVQGRRYTLHVELPDGNVYVSNSVFLQKRPVIDSLYANPITRRVYMYDTDHKPLSQDQHGLSILADLSGNSDSTLYYRFETKFVKEMMYTTNLTTLLQYSIFLWELDILDNSYSVNFTNKKDNRQSLDQYHVGFLQYYYDASNETETTTGIFIVAWVLKINVYSISHDVYNYYNSIALQLKAKDQIFAPVPAQITSNIHCINDANKEVIGVFEAVSLTKIYKAFGWNTLNDYYARDLSTFPEYITNGDTTRFRPAWWIQFRL